MRKITTLLMIAFCVTTINGFATGKNDKDKGKAKTATTTKCTMGGASCCKKPSSRAALLKAKPVAKKGA